MVCFCLKIAYVLEGGRASSMMNKARNHTVWSYSLKGLLSFQSAEYILKNNLIQFPNDYFYNFNNPSHSGWGFVSVNAYYVNIMVMN